MNGFIRQGRRSPRRAAALILVLWAIAVLALLAGGLSFAIRQDLAVVNLQQGRLTAHLLARAGVERAIAEIMDHTATIHTLGDSWCDNKIDMRDTPLKGGTFSVLHVSHDPSPRILYGASDESAKLNLNVATREQLLALPNMTESIAAAIIDWRDSDDDPEPQGAEGSYYASLARPYKIRNAPLRSVRELLLVRGVTPELLYGEDLNANGLRYPHEDDGNAALWEDNADRRLGRGWFAYLTVYSYERNVDGQGRRRLNVNTADAATLGQRLNLEEWAALSIVKAREQKQFVRLTDLLNVQRDTSVPRKPGDDPDLNMRGENEKDQPLTQGMFERLVDRMTLEDHEVLGGRINLNTAPKEVLKTLPGVDGDEELAEAIIRYRRTGTGFTTIGGLLNVDGMNKEKFARLESFVTVRSSVFRILSRGTAVDGWVEATIECIVDCGGDVPRIMYWLESSP